MKMNAKEKPMKSAGAVKKKSGFTAEEKAAMQERVRELKSTDGEADVLAKIASMQASDRVMAERFHALVKRTAPDLAARTWYGMPAYTKNGNVICWFQDANKFKSRFAQIGFSDKARLDEGELWPIAYAVQKVGPAEEAKIAALLKRAVS